MIYSIFCCAPLHSRISRLREGRRDSPSWYYSPWTTPNSDGYYLYFHLLALQNIHFATIIGTEERSVFLSFLARSSALRRFSTSVYNLPLATDWFSTSMPYLTDIELRNPPQEFLLDFIQKLDRTQDKLFLPPLQNLTLRHCIVDSGCAFVTKHFKRDVSRAKTRLFSDRFELVPCRTTTIRNPLH
ncbi:hypothetical protein B0H14DRAFT_1698257 [Mycena olivaceomarginata]|nr:hypothetical protein B0H14DRAFT_1698257 [Mycena olivaceomarginata]